MTQDNREPTRARRSARYAYENGSANNDEPESIAIETETNHLPQSHNNPKGGEAEMREPMDGQHNLQPNDGYRAQPSAGETNLAETNPAAQPQPISPAAYCAVRRKPLSPPAALTIGSQPVKRMDTLPNGYQNKLEVNRGMAQGTVDAPHKQTFSGNDVALEVFSTHTTNAVGAKEPSLADQRAGRSGFTTEAPLPPTHTEAWPTREMPDIDTSSKTNATRMGGIRIDPDSDTPNSQAYPYSSAAEQGVLHTASNRAERLNELAMHGNIAYAPDEAGVSLYAQPRTDVTGDVVDANPVLTPNDFNVAFGTPRSATEEMDLEVANAFARAWAVDGDVLRYDGANPIEADAPPSKSSRAAAGWLPATEPELPQSISNTVIRPVDFGKMDENQLFEAYGASYAEAYAVALSLEFHEEKPVPDDNTGDVKGPVSSILHTPSGQPILLGTMVAEHSNEDDTDEAILERLAPEPPLPLGRKIVRYALLTLGAGSLAVAGLYFGGFLL